MTTRRRHPLGFTLAELLVALAIVAIIAAITIAAFGQLAKDARLSSGVNSVTAALDNARALALEKNGTVMLVFRPRVDHGVQTVEIVLAQWTGEAFPATVGGVGGSTHVIDRFEPIADAAPLVMPPGTKVAGPSFETGDDHLWITQSHLPLVGPEPGVGEAPGRLLGVMFGPDGTTITRNARTDSSRVFVDFDRDGRQTLAPGTAGAGTLDYSTFLTVSSGLFHERYPVQRHADDEPFVQFVPFLAVYDDEQARALSGVDDWVGDPVTRREELSAYIRDRADRIHFNRYTGVVMR